MWSRGPALYGLSLIDHPEAREIAEAQLARERWLRRRSVKKWVRKSRRALKGA